MNELGCIQHFESVFSCYTSVQKSCGTQLVRVNQEWRHQPVRVIAGTSIEQAHMCRQGCCPIAQGIYQGQVGQWATLDVRRLPGVCSARGQHHRLRRTKKVRIFFFITISFTSLLYDEHCNRSGLHVPKGNNLHCVDAQHEWI